MCFFNHSLLDISPLDLLNVLKQFYNMKGKGILTAVIKVV